MTSPLTSDLSKKLARSKEFRSEFVVAHAKHSIPMQIRDLMAQQNLTQTELARRAGLPQPTVSRAANPSYGNLTINTLVRIAAGFDVAFVGHFVPFSKFLGEMDEDRKGRPIPKFDDEFTVEGGRKPSPRKPPVSALNYTAHGHAGPHIGQRYRSLREVRPIPIRAELPSRRGQGMARNLDLQHVGAQDKLGKAFQAECSHG